MTDLKTKPSFRIGTSQNELDFNVTNETQINSSGKVSILTNLQLAETAEDMFNEALAAIENNVMSPLCNALIARDCNKPIDHNYSQLYHLLFRGFRQEHLDFVEIGIGTNNLDVPSHMPDYYAVGSSLRGWSDYFENPKTQIVGGDVDPRILFEEPRITTGYINQLNPNSILEFLKNKKLDVNKFDVLLDDGLHEYRSNISLLLTAWPYLKRGGIYLIEDINSGTFNDLFKVIRSLDLNADVAGFALPSPNKFDNRIIALQKHV